MLGSAEQWFYAGLGGIRVDFSRPPPEQIVVQPAFLAAITSVDCTYASVVGDVRVHWQRVGEELALDLTIPANTTATLILPQFPGGEPIEGGRAISRAEGIQAMPEMQGAARYRLSSGTYHIRLHASTPERISHL